MSPMPAGSDTDYARRCQLLAWSPGTPLPPWDSDLLARADELIAPRLKPERIAGAGRPLAGRRARELDGVRLRWEVDGWPPGALGAVIAEHSETALVEIVEWAYETDEEFGLLPVHDLFELLVDVPYDALEVAEPADELPDPRARRGDQ